MPFDVTGFVEIKHDHSDDPVWAWQVVILLDAFLLSGDIISDRLFGLSKHTQGGLFSGRGIPISASSAVVSWAAENASFVRQHGDGDFGHTYASWREVSSADLSCCEISESNWNSVFELCRVLERPRGPFHSECIRIVVAGNW